MGSDRYGIHSRVFLDVCESERNRAEGIVASERHGDMRKRDKLIPALGPRPTRWLQASFLGKHSDLHVI